jgi:hypothetical protein
VPVDRVTSRTSCNSGIPSADLPGACASNQDVPLRIHGTVTPSCQSADRKSVGDGTVALVCNEGVSPRGSSIAQCPSGKLAIERGKKRDPLPCPRHDYRCERAAPPLNSWQHERDRISDSQRASDGTELSPPLASAVELTVPFRHLPRESRGREMDAKSLVGAASLGCIASPLERTQDDEDLVNPTYATLIQEASSSEMAKSWKFHQEAHTSFMKNPKDAGTKETGLCGIETGRRPSSRHCAEASSAPSSIGKGLFQSVKSSMSQSMRRIRALRVCARLQNLGIHFFLFPLRPRPANNIASPGL